mmetsp:Transcript_28199/g.65851  ORF Transcript_28199/g.65851 Transcript_28199/m.65851 type:complete len:230 (-) Transcript_28199:281-970(-)
MRAVASFSLCRVHHCSIRPIISSTLPSASPLTPSGSPTSSSLSFPAPHSIFFEDGIAAKATMGLSPSKGMMWATNISHTLCSLVHESRSPANPKHPRLCPARDVTVANMAGVKSFSEIVVPCSNRCLIPFFLRGMVGPIPRGNSMSPFVSMASCLSLQEREATASRVSGVKTPSSYMEMRREALDTLICCCPLSHRRGRKAFHWATLPVESHEDAPSTRAGGDSLVEAT